MPYIDNEPFGETTLMKRDPAIGYPLKGKEKAFAKVQRLACARERCQSELRARLERDGFSPEDADEAIARAVACGLVDDLRYAEVLTRSRIAQGKGRCGIEAELSRAGIDVCALPGWPDEFFSQEEDSELKRAIALLHNKPPRAKDIRAAAFRRLVQKGYSHHVACEATRRFCEEAR